MGLGMWQSAVSVLMVIDGRWVLQVHESGSQVVYEYISKTTYNFKMTYIGFFPLEMLENVFQGKSRVSRNSRQDFPWKKS
jgi:hypothetical protein